MGSSKSVAALSLGIAIAACSPDPETTTADEIASSLEMGDDIEQTLPYGLALYPGATVKAKLLAGSGTQIETDASLKDLRDFYVSEVSDKGFRIESANIADGKAQITAQDENDPKTGLSLSITPDKSGTYVLIILRLASEPADQIALPEDAPENCRIEAGLEICLRSDFDRAIDVTLANKSDERIGLAHSVGIYTATITIYDTSLEMIGNGPWEGTPPPDLKLGVDGGETVVLQFHNSNSLDWVPLEEAKRICYRTRFTSDETPSYSTMTRLCIDEA